MTTETGIAPYVKPFALLAEDSDLRALMDENLGEGATFGLNDIPRWTFPGSGSKQWQWNSPSGKVFRDTIEGVVLGQRTRRMFYESKFDGGGSRPNCSSDDGVVGRTLTFDDGTPDNVKITPSAVEVAFGGDCASCPLNQWESGRLFDPSYHGNGKACAEYRDLLIMEPDGVMPIILQLPSTSLRDWQDVGKSLLYSRLGLSRAALRFSIDLPKGAAYGSLGVEIVGTINADTAASLKSFMPDLKRPPALELPPPADTTEDDGAIPF